MSAVLRRRAEAIVTTHAASGGPRQVLWIAHTFSLGLGFVPEVLVGLLECHPDLRFRCYQSCAMDAVTRLRGDADARLRRTRRGGAAAVHRTPGVRGADRGSADQALSGAPAGNEGSVVRCVGREQPREPVPGFLPRVSVEGSHPFVVESMAGAEPDGRSPPSARRADPDRDGGVTARFSWRTKENPLFR
ncbi:hypothetical protein ACQPXB_18680 [Amycolatopsis sp. CA-161197]|uniref:hypothetical protein n=1 Tax=Amycolatopsis sp. CA-161197 TaxID=3239922 RepID=UPI003D9432D9